VRLALVQMNSVVGDIGGTERKVREHLGRARERDRRTPITNRYGG
jgi:hypothetical protein